MNRRQFVHTSVAAGALGASGLAAARPAEDRHYYELRSYHLRNDLQPGRIQAFFEEHFIPAARRLGAGPVGCFTPSTGMITPALVVLLDYPSLDTMQAVAAQAMEDATLNSAWRTFETETLPYARYEAALFRAFAGHPQPEVPPAREQGRLFELRTYESRNAFSLQDKIEMFNQEEIDIFRNNGFAPIFFGEALYGTRLPHLTYMVAFDDMAARDQAWQNFGSDADWARIRDRPGWTNPEAVSNITSAFLRPTSFSQIR